MPFITNEIYHIYNRSVGRENIFSAKLNLRKILEATNYYRYPQTMSLSKWKSLPNDAKQHYIFGITTTQPLVEIYVFSFMPNHYHFLVKQLQDDGIEYFLTKLQNCFAKYFNTKFDRHGSLFQIQFKARRIETDEQFVHVSRYIHLNHVTAYHIHFSELCDSPWTSFPYYINGGDTPFVNTKPILSFFKDREDYKVFVADQVEYQRTLGDIKDLILE